MVTKKRDIFIRNHFVPGTKHATMADCLERDYSSDSSNDSFNELLNLKIFSQESILPAEKNFNDNDDDDDIEADKNHSDGEADKKNDNHDNNDKSLKKITQSDDEPPSISAKATAAETARGTSTVSRMNVTPPKEPKAKTRIAQSPILSNDDFLTEQELEAKGVHYSFLH